MKSFFSICSFFVGFFILINRIFEYNREIWIFLGNLTYSSYLIHFPLQILLIILFKIFEIDFLKVKVYFIFILTTFFLSVFIYKSMKSMQKYIRSKYIK